MVWISEEKFKALVNRVDAAERTAITSSYECLKIAKELEQLTQEVHRLKSLEEHKIDTDAPEASFLTKDGTYSVSRFRSRRKGSVEE